MTEQDQFDSNIDQGADTTVALGKGLDVGTANLAAAVQNDAGGITVNVERNAFLDIPSDAYSKSMLTKLKVPYVVHNGKLVVIGEAAFELANVFGRETRRPMADGLISPNEQDALPMMKMIIQKILGEPQVPGEHCYFCVPAPSLDVDNNVVYHQGLFESNPHFPALRSDPMAPSGASRRKQPPSSGFFGFMCKGRSRIQTLHGKETAKVQGLWVSARRTKRRLPPSCGMVTVMVSSAPPFS